MQCAFFSQHNIYIFFQHYYHGWRPVLEKLSNENCTNIYIAKIIPDYEHRAPGYNQNYSLNRIIKFITAYDTPHTTNHTAHRALQTTPHTVHYKPHHSPRTTNHTAHYKPHHSHNTKSCQFCQIFCQIDTKNKLLLCKLYI